MFMCIRRCMYAYAYSCAYIYIWLSLRPPEKATPLGLWFSAPTQVEGLVSKAKWLRHVQCIWASSVSLQNKKYRRTHMHVMISFVFVDDFIYFCWGLYLFLLMISLIHIHMHMIYIYIYRSPFADRTKWATLCQVLVDGRAHVYICIYIYVYM